MKIPITRPFFDDCEKEMIVKPLDSGWVVQGPFVNEFEKSFAAFTGSNFAVATSNCTTALHLSLESLGLKTGDKVIVPSFTYVASANAVEYTGAEVVLCDIDLSTFNIDANRAEELLEQDKSRSIKAIMPVHLFGLCADMPRVMALADKYGLKVVEDAACGFGAMIGGKHAGTFGDCGCFSFHPRKAITTGEGGMITTDNEELAAKAAILRDHGASVSDLRRHSGGKGSLLPDFNVKGYNYRMTDMQGALGVCQLKKAKHILDKRRKIAGRYDNALSDIGSILTPHVPADYIHGYQSYVCLFTGGEDPSGLNIANVDRLNALRNELMGILEGKGIATRQGTHAVHTLGYYRDKYGFRSEDFTTAYAADRLSVALPLYAGMTDKEFEYVVTNIKAALKQ
jgi:perosamine synthetase